MPRYWANALSLTAWPFQRTTPALAPSRQSPVTAAARASGHTARLTVAPPPHAEKWVELPNTVWQHVLTVTAMASFSTSPVPATTADVARVEEKIGADLAVFTPALLKWLDNLTPAAGAASHDLLTFNQTIKRAPGNSLSPPI